MALDESLLSNISPKKREPSIVGRRKVPRAKTKRVNPWESLDEEVVMASPIEQFNRVDTNEVTTQKKQERKQLTKKIQLKKSLAIKKEKVKTKVSDPVRRPTKNFTQIPNSILEFLYTSNISQNECKFLLLIIKETLGWGRDYCLLSKKDILDKSSITNNLIYKVRESLSANGVISYGKSEESSKNFYMINAKFFKVSNEDEIIETVGTSEKIENKDLILFLEKHNKTKKSLAGENTSILELIDSKKNESEILRLLINLERFGALDGSVCSRPASYLASGAYEAVLGRCLGKSVKIFDGQKIIDLLTSVNTSEKMSEEVRESLTESELEWIEKKGGLFSLGKMNTESLKFELKI